jgi:hypothetical protein
MNSSLEILELLNIPEDPVPHGRAIQSLCKLTGAEPAEVRDLFSSEFSRLEMGAKVGTYLTVLTESNVRAMLRRKARLAAKGTRTSVRVR